KRCVSHGVAPLIVAHLAPRRRGLKHYDQKAEPALPRVSRPRLKSKSLESYLQWPSVHIHCSLMNRSAGTWLWDDVRFFLAVARAGSLSGAARVLGVGHVTVGRRIALFEKRLGVTLLNRTPDGFTVTSAGDAILRQCMAMENAALDLERIAAGRDSLVAGSVRVTATEALAYQ